MRISPPAIHGLDMVVYYVPVDGDLLEVTATFAPKTGGDPLRVVMGLADGDSVAFSMPGHRDSLYAFSRSGEEVTVSSETRRLSSTHKELVEIEKQVQESTAKHNGFLKELGLSPLPWAQ